MLSWVKDKSVEQPHETVPDYEEFVVSSSSSSTGIIAPSPMIQIVM